MTSENRRGAQARFVGLAEAMAAEAFGVNMIEMRTRTRRHRAPEARQVAIYLAHTVCGISLRALSRFLGRHPSTAIHACRQVEARRDRAEFDRALDRMERQLRRAVEARP
ncbi:MAG: chromosomal replication initiator DnaA [Alphaproteobacteria bacterium]|nr:chromosomal replication initiator DnaA [Alphaproteobacteria bacterium]MBN9579800.1 chromosomal replication initiator DnaA [Alphaproteobacteria bacterium]MBN9593356.1 chromosomal replication initiator DnaA [Alphaproteobacteria bacterium]